MSITTHPNGTDWIVTALWFGEIRTIFTGTVFGCINFCSEMAV